MREGGGCGVSERDGARFEISEGAGHILRALSGAGHGAWLVGGCVRDLLRGAAPHDWDICTTALPEETMACFAGQRVLTTGLKHGTVTVLEGDAAFEVTTCRADGPYSDGRRPDGVRFVSDLEQDLARRDFTVNAMAMDLDGALIDPWGGRADLDAGLVRCVGDPDRRFQEDGLRVMRALRFAAVLGFDLEGDTARAVHQNRAMLRHVSAERLSAELSRLLCGQAVGPALRDFPDVLCEFWPELDPLVRLEQHNPWHCWGGWEHTVRTVEAVRPSPVPRLTMLLHDSGKPAVKTTDEDGIDHFYGHPAVSAQIAEELLGRLRFDRSTLEQVVRLVRLHNTPMRPEEKAVRRLLSKLGAEGFGLLLEVHRADSMGQAYEKVQGRLAELDRVRAIADELLAEEPCLSLRDLAVTGRDVLAAGVPSGPEVGKLLRGLLERVIDEELPNDREVLLRAIAERYEKGR